MVHIVILQIIRFRIHCDERVPLLEANQRDERVGFGGFEARHADKHASARLEGGAPYIVDSSASGSASPSFRTLVKCIALSDWKRHKKMMPARSKLFKVAKAGAPALFPVGQGRS
jgi:hypothetical protein